MFTFETIFFSISYFYNFKFTCVYCDLLLLNCSLRNSTYCNKQFLIIVTKILLNIRDHSYEFFFRNLFTHAKFSTLNTI